MSGSSPFLQPPPPLSPLSPLVLVQHVSSTSPPSFSPQRSIRIRNLPPLGNSPIRLAFCHRTSRPFDSGNTPPLGSDYVLASPPISSLSHSPPPPRKARVTDALSLLSSRNIPLLVLLFYDLPPNPFLRESLCSHCLIGVGPPIAGPIAPPPPFSKAFSSYELKSPPPRRLKKKLRSCPRPTTNPLPLSNTSWRRRVRYIF